MLPNSNSPSQCLLRLSSSLQNINKCIKDSKELLFNNEKQKEDVMLCRSRVKINGMIEGRLQLNIRVEFEKVGGRDDEKKKQKRNGRKRVSKRDEKEKPFGVLNEVKKSDIIAQNNNQKQKQQENQDEIFSFGDQTQPSPQSSSLPQVSNPNHNTAIQQISDYWIGSQDPHIKIVEESDYENEQIFQTPSRTIPEQSQELQYQYQKEQIECSTNQKQDEIDDDREKKPNFGSRFYESHFLELDDRVRQNPDKFKSVKDKLDKTDLFIKESMEKHRKMQEQHNCWTERKSTQCNLTPRTKESKSRSQSKQKHNSLKLGLLAYFSKSTVMKNNKRPGQVCDKYRMELQRDKRQRYLAEALKIPFVSKYFTFSDLEDFYRSFKATNQPQYKWPQYIIKKIKGPQKFTIFSQFCAKQIPK